MITSVSLRRWQRRALEQFSAKGTSDFLAVATPGAGKTTFALAAARIGLGGDPSRRLIVVAPTQHLKTQWADAAAGFGLHLSPEWSSSSGRLPADTHGVVVTYQQVASSSAALRTLVNGAFVVFDEVHHAADDRAWGEGLRQAFEPAQQRLSISGTPFRSDTSAIPFVTYDHMEEARADYEYGYGEALVDGGVVRPVFFPRINGHMEWAAPDGSIHAHTFDDPIAIEKANQRLRTALSVEGEWLPNVLGQANDRLKEIRADHPDAGGLIIAADQEHAREISAMLRDRFGTSSVVVLSDDPNASARISSFASGTEPWIVAVRMVSEGVDIPRLRVGVYATVTTTELFFRQAVGRLVRWSGTDDERAYLFIPDDHRLRSHASNIAEQRRHSLRKREQDREGLALPSADLDAVRADGDAEQLSMFDALSSVATDQDVTSVFSNGFAERWGGVAAEISTVEIDLAPPPPLPGLAEALAGGGSVVDVRDRRRIRKDLKERNGLRVRELVRSTGWAHAQVNSELNRLAGIDRIDEATLAQLERRIAEADKWLTRAG